MNLSYPLRIACLAIVSIGLLQIAFELLLWLAAPILLRLTRSLPLRQRERTLFLIQFTPLTLALAFAGFFCIPQYVSSETNFAAESVGWACLLLAVTLIAWWAAKAFSGLRMAIRTLLFSRACTRDAAATLHGPTPIVAIESTHSVGLVGLLRPFIFISRSLLEDGALNPLALEIVLDHERSHAAQRDNWKLLSLHCLPRLGLRLLHGKTWMQLWQNTAEWAADDDAVRGNSARALLLAETLVALARASSTRGPELACTYLVSHETDLALRIERLLDLQPACASSSAYKLAATLTLAVAASAFLIATYAPILGDLSERLLHLG